MRFIFITLTCWALSGWTITATAQTNLSLAQMREDIDLLTRNMGKVTLELEAQQRRIAELNETLEAVAERVATFEAEFDAYVEASDRALEQQRQNQLTSRREIVNEVKRLVEALGRDVQQQLDTLSRAQPAAPAQPQITFDDDFPKTGIEYEVQPGDTLSTIAQKLGSRVIWIQKANRIIDPTRLQAGQNIFVPQEN